VTEQEVIAWFKTGSSGRIARVILAGQEIIDERFADGVFE
jgi:hypothetical protein